MNSIVMIFASFLLLAILRSTIAINCYQCKLGTDGCGASTLNKVGLGVGYMTDSSATYCTKFTYPSNGNSAARYYLTSGSCVAGTVTTNADIPYGQSTGQCLSATTVTPINGSFVCRCDCCNTGSATCSPVLIGYSTAFSCSSASCSVSCSSTYPLVCISNENGQTQGTCQGLTTTTTTVSSWLGYPCSCYCCQWNSYCNPTTFVGNTSSTLCSTYTCSSACQQQYSSLCPLSTSIGQTLGQCLTISNGSTRCQCTCCGSIACLDYDIYTNSDCTTCPLMCSLYTKCANTYQTTYLCYTNSTYRQQFSILFLIFIIFNDYTTFI
ncbi:hypothetical protein I4U23_027157 [Adineta vaga]|nr:hypothetical protein I4U23_027157 [Adineta vaga]